MRTGTRRNRTGPGLVIGAILLAAGHGNAMAGEEGRYRAIVLQEGGASNNSATLAPKVFIMDTRDGHMWTWEQNSRITTPRGGLTFGNALIYQGRVKPGERPGDVVLQQQR